jgi:two-component system OmpR family response regulator
MIPMSPFDDAGWPAQPAALPTTGERPQSAPAREPDAPEARALLIDPDPETAGAAALHMLRQNLVAIDQVASPEAAFEALLRRRYGLVILELADGCYDGAGLCRGIVERGGPPVMIWSIRASPLEQVMGLELGAEDYLAKAAHPLEFLARVRVILRRERQLASLAPAAGAAANGRSWLFEGDAHRVRSASGLQVRLRPACAALLQLLCERPRRRVEREEIRVWISGDGALVAPRTVDVMVSRLRRSLQACDGGENLIQTVRSGGYRLDATVETAATGVIIHG